MGSFTHISLWVLASVFVSLVVGIYLGRSTGLSKERRKAEEERRVALRTLVELLKSVEDLTSDVDHRSTEMRAVHNRVGDLRASGELELVRQVLLRQVSSVLESNQKLEDDLVYARCRMQQQAEEIDRTRHEAHSDALSGVANRKALDDRLLVLLGGLKRGGDPFALVLIDMDHFKWINDTHGHTTGDHVLQQFGTLLKRVVRDGDFVGRYGGDEFALLLPFADLDVAAKVSDRLRAETTKTNFGSGLESAVTISVGVAAARPTDTPVSLIERADKALYASKHGGRNRVHCEPRQETAADADRLAAAHTS